MVSKRINKAAENQACAREKLLPWMVAVAVLLCVTIGLTYYSYKNKPSAGPGRQIGAASRAATVKANGGAAALQGKPVAFIPPWHQKTVADALTGATPKRASFNKAIMIVSPSVIGINTSGKQGQNGSGILVHSRGYILTSYHIVDKADEIVVTLTTDDLIKSYTATVIDSRPDLDLAILKLKSTGKTIFVPAPLGNSDLTVIGEDVVVIGSPFGLAGSASAGIISNTRRTLNAGNKQFNNLIQTDAPINPGSSGGALVNSKAEVIGVNMAIYSPVEGFTGVGFAVPINQARQAFGQFIEIVPSPLANAKVQSGQVRGGAPGTIPGGGFMRMVAGQPGQPAQPEPPGQPGQPGLQKCWLGIAVNSVDAVIEREFNLPLGYGVLVNRVFPDSPAAQAGIARGDVIYRVDSKRIRDENMLWDCLKVMKVGDKVRLAYVRNGKFESCVAVLENEPPNARALLSQVPQGVAAGAAGPEGIEEISWMGIDIQPLSNAAALAEFGISPRETGVYIGEIEGVGGIEAGLAPGDVIKKINNQEVKDMNSFKEIVKNVDISKGVLLDILRNNKLFYTTLQPTDQNLGAWQPTQPAQQKLLGVW